MALPSPPGLPSVFGSMLDRSAGIFGLVPEGTEVPSHRRYLPGSMVLETTWQTPTGWLQVYDCLVAHRWHGGKRREQYKRAPGDFVAAQMLLRVATCVDGDVELILNCLPLFDYGRDTGSWSYATESYDVATIRASRSDLDLRLTSSLPLELTGPRALARGRLREGENAFAALSWGEARGHPSPAEGRRAVWWTTRDWRQWLKAGKFPDHPWRCYLERSALTLKGLSYAPTGAILAGGDDLAAGDSRRRAQLGLPLHLGPRLGLHALGAVRARASSGRRTSTSRSSRGGRGGPAPDHVRHRRRAGARPRGHSTTSRATRAPARCGSATAPATSSSTTCGACCSTRSRSTPAALPAANPEAGMGPDRRARATTRQSHWQQPDRGIWEVRGEPKHFTASKVMCWVALDRGVRARRGAGRRPSAPALAASRRRSTPTSASTASTPGACSFSTTRRTRSMRPRS